MTTALELPLLDLNQYLPKGETLLTAKDAVLRDIGDALVPLLQKHGFTTLRGLPASETKFFDKCRDVSSSLFQLPQEMKELYNIDYKTFHGYLNNLSYERGDDDLENYESFNFCIADGAFPDDSCPSFRSTAIQTSESADKLFQPLLRATALGIGMDPDEFCSRHPPTLSPESISCIRFLFYPPVPPNTSATRLKSHTDFGTLTISSQTVNGGLEFQNPSTKEWISLDDYENSDLCILIAGKMLSLWTCDAIPAVVHRIVVKPKPTETPTRKSLIYFCLPANKTVIHPCTNLLKDPIPQPKDMIAEDELKKLSDAFYTGIETF